jgi:DNA-3-methyladenine glycosylase
VTPAPLSSEFFAGAPPACAAALIGMEFRWHGCGGIIVETEAYAALGDPACHTFFRKGARDFVNIHPAGTAYVYLNYGIHWLFNVLVKGPEGDGFVLIRALQPTMGIQTMRGRRPASSDAHLCAGPGRLTRAVGIGHDAHAQRFLHRAGSGIFPPSKRPLEILADHRIGISKARDRPWRFLLGGSASVSKPPSHQAVTYAP